MHKELWFLFLAAICHSQIYEIVEPQYPRVIGIDSAGNHVQLQIKAFMDSNSSFIFKFKEYKKLFLASNRFDSSIVIGTIIKISGIIDSTYLISAEPENAAIAETLFTFIHTWQFDSLRGPYRSIELQYEFKSQFGNGHGKQQNVTLTAGNRNITPNPGPENGSSNDPSMLTCEQSMEIGHEDAKKDTSIKRFGRNGFLTGFGFGTIVGPLSIAWTAYWCSTSETQFNRKHISSRIKPGCYESVFVPELRANRKRRALSMSTIGLGSLYLSVATVGALWILLGL